MISNITVALNPEQFKEIIDFTIKYPKIYDSILKKSIDSPPLSSYYKMFKNIHLTSYIYKETTICNRYFNLNTALAKLTAESILVMIEEIGIYCVFNDALEFKLLYENMYSNCISSEFRENDKSNTFTPYQIILSNHKQKIVFLANGKPEDIETIVKHCKTEINPDVLVLNADDHIEITMQIPVDDLEQTNERFNQFAHKLNIYDKELLQNVKLSAPREITTYDKKFIMVYIGEENEKMNIGYDYKRILNYLPQATNTTIIINNNNNTTNNNCNNITGNENEIATKTINNNEGLRPKTQTDKTVDWISGNLPPDYITTLDYYEQYRTAFNKINCMHPSKFNELVCEYNYKKVSNASTKRKQVWEAI
jgi:hypothetical protein